MEFELNEEQRILQDTLERFMETGVRDGPLASRWQALADLGGLGIGFAEAQGGFGGGARELSLVLETAGRWQRTEPLIDALAVPGHVLAVADPERLRALVTGTTLWVAALAEPHDPTGQRPGARYEEGRVSGAKRLVPQGAGATRALIPAREGETLVLAEIALTEGLATSQPMMDGHSGLRLTLQAVPATILARGTVAEAASRAGWRAELFAICVQALGLARALFESTHEYVRLRKQFGQSIGRFQVIQHRLADMLIALEEARALTDMAVHALDADQPEADLLMARTGILERAIRIGQGAIQLHGGIGMSEELPIGGGFRALKVLQARAGGEPFHRAALRAQILTAAE